MSEQKVLNLTESDLSYYSDHMIVLFYNDRELLTKWQIVARMVSGIVFTAVFLDSDLSQEKRVEVYKDHKIEATYNGPYEIPDLVEYVLSLECDRDYGLRRYSRSL